MFYFTTTRDNVSPFHISPRSFTQSLEWKHLTLLENITRKETEHWRVTLFRVLYWFISSFFYQKEKGSIKYHQQEHMSLQVSKLYHSGRCCSDSRATERKSRQGTNNMTRGKGNVGEQKLILPYSYLLSHMSNLYHSLRAVLISPLRKGEIVVQSHRAVCHSYRMW